MLAAITFAIGTTILIKLKKEQYVALTIIPMIFISAVTFVASIENIVLTYLPTKQYLLVALSVILIIMLIAILFESIKAWIGHFKTGKKIEYYSDAA